MHPGIPRLVLVTPMVAALAVTLTAGAPTAAAPETPALRSISSRLDGALSTVLIEASEPVAYLTSQPDPLTVLVDLRNIYPEGLAQEAGFIYYGLGRMGPQPPVSRPQAEAPGGGKDRDIRQATT